MAVRVKELMPTKLLWAAVRVATFAGTVVMIVMIDAIPMEKAIGTPVAKSITKDINIMARAFALVDFLLHILLLLLYHWPCLKQSLLLIWP